MNYGPASKYYDLFASKDDVHFYKELALEHGKKTLELGVGTCRVAIELAKANISVWGIDTSRHMLRIARQKVRNESASVRQRIVLELGDMRHFKLKETFPLIYIASSTFEHCTTKNDQENCLTSAYNALERNGTLVFDISQPKTEQQSLTSLWIDRRVLNRNEEVVRTIFSRRNPQTDVVSVNLFFDVYRHGELKKRYYELGEALISHKQDVERMLRKVGFKLSNVYGNFDRSAYNEKSERAIFIATKP
jgi:ubiquinone/menaquinone biosynthesis C-methylase UbiE